ncbi:MAG: glutathione S-transferase family protein [Pseudomonadota bacterium]
MTDTITLYAHMFSSRAERCLWTLNELGLEHDVKRIDYNKGELTTPEFLAISPGGKIPALTHGDRSLTESTAICEYVARLKPEGRMLPETADEQADYSRLMHYLITEVEAYLWVADQAGRLKALYPWPDGTAEFAKKRVAKNIRAVAHMMDDSSEFACCGRLTVVDVLMVQIIGWARMYKIDMPEKLLAHRKMMMARPACPESMKPKSAA